MVNSRNRVHDVALARRSRAVALYSIFAAFSILVNLLAQFSVARIYTGPFNTQLSLAAGIASGLIVKYFLDKTYIFQIQAKNLSHDLKLFALYVAMSLVTTAIFLSLEFGLYYLCRTDTMRYTGGAIGLAIGYMIKYQLDKRYVFSE